MKLKDSLLASHRRRAQVGLEVEMNFLFNPGSKMIPALLVTICLVGFPYQGSSIILESGKVNDYEVVYPQKVHALPQGGTLPDDQKTKYEDTMQYAFKVNGEPVVLHLERNKELFSKDYTETHYSPDGREITTSPQIKDHCYYHGHIQNDGDSTASINACDGLKGHFKHQGETYLIEPLKFSDSEAHAVYKYENVEKEETPKICGLTQTTWKSDEPIKKTYETYVTPEQKKYLEAQKYVEVYLVVDNFMFKKYSRNVIIIRMRAFELINYLNTIYKPLKIIIALIGLEIWSEEDKIEVTGLSSPTLNAFAAWRESDLLKRKRNDHAQLLTGLDLSKEVLGVSYLNGMCTSQKSAAVVQDHSKTSLFVASAMAHQIGHNMGMQHDAHVCICQSGPCIMTPKPQDIPPEEFSSCSLNSHYQYLKDFAPQCILNKPFYKDIITPPICGNGLVEWEEDCDCGSPEQCENECCEAAKCKLKPWAKCAEGECCEKCQFKRAGELCRGARDDCDVAELCTGKSAVCPMDGFKKNGQPCRNNVGYCYNGKCPTLANQCIALWGAGVKVAPYDCFQLNQKGDEHGHCRKENDRNIPCESKDITCGRLYCTGGSETPSVGETVSLSSCKGSFSKEDAEVGMVGPGTKCGQGMVCKKGQCVDVKTAYGSAINFSQI